VLGTCYIENVNRSVSKVTGCGVNGRGEISGNLGDILVFSLAATFRQAVTQGWRTYGTWHSSLSQYFISLYPTSVFIFLRISIHIDIWDCIETVYELPLLPNNTVSDEVLHKSGVVWSADWIFSVGTSAWRWLGEYMTLDKAPNNFCFQTGRSNSHSYFHIFLFIAFLAKTFIRNIMIIQGINYIT